MTQEEKAKAYDKAIERLRNAFYNNNSRMCEEYRNAVLKIIEPIFPELKESEDELTWLKKFIQEEIDYLSFDIRDSEDRVKLKNLHMSIAWLEAQGEQKPQRMVSAEAKEAMYNKPAWSEEDEYCIHQLIVFCENCMVQDDGAKRCAQWLKSLRPQSQWKPSDEQMDTLEYYMHTLICNEHKEVLFGLYADLKKLKE